MFKEPLDNIIDNCEGAMAAVVMGFDGIPVEAISRNIEVDVKTIGTELSEFLAQVRKAAEILEAGALSEVSIRSESLTFIVRMLNADYFVGVAMKPNGNFGKGRFLLRMALPDLVSQL